MAEQTQSTQSLMELVNDLPRELRQEVRDYAEYLLYKYQKRTAGRLARNWRGVLRDIDEGISSVELQHKITREWRDEDIANQISDSDPAD